MENVQPELHSSNTTTQWNTTEETYDPGAPQKTSPRTDKILKHEVLSEPAVTASALKEKHPDLLKDISIRTLQHSLQKDLSLLTQHTTRKPLLTEAVK